MDHNFISKDFFIICTVVLVVTFLFSVLQLEISEEEFERVLSFRHIRLHR